MSTNKSIVKSASIISAATILSRVLGFIRDIIIAKLFGTKETAQAFVVAFRIPNLLRDLVGEGATNSAVVPVFSEYLVTKKREEFWRLANVILNLLFISLSVIAILGITCAPLIVRIIAPGFIEDPGKLNLTIKLTRILFPYLIFIGLTAYSMGVLFTFKSFFTPSLSPCLLNISTIVAALLASQRMKEPIVGLAIGVLVGGLLQLIIQIPPLFKKGFKLIRLENTASYLSHPGAKQIGKLLLPRVFGSAIYQLNVFVDTICASLAQIVGEGAVAAIYYSNRLIQFPMAVFGIALSSAALPTMSEFAAIKDFEKLKRTLNFSLRGIFLIMLPSQAMLIALATPLTKIFFQRGEFNSYSTLITSSALLYYALGLFAYAGVKILVSCFYSLQDTKTPVKVAALSLIVNVILNVILMFPLKVGGIALASAVSATLNFSILFSILKKRIGNFDAGFFDFFLRIFLVSLLTGIVVFIFWQSYFLNLNEIFKLGLGICLGLAVFIFIAFLIKIREIKDLVLWLLKKR
ncbi:MAG: murein biosynthesis integral membrane protein MurJ [Candidatus Omnitrophota bacterium]|nr:murein biosynthesis integral membrane protein MurJ [Candidatus Omnitrophota bacterium]